MKRVTWAQARQVVPVLPRLRATQGFVYLATAAGGLVKIGHSKSPQRRVGVMNGESTRAIFKDRHGFDHGPAEVAVLIGDCGCVHERALQHAFEAEALGGEWFRGPETSGLLSGLLALATDSAAVMHTEGQRLLSVRLSARGAAANLARETGISSASMSQYRSGHQRPDSSARVALQQAVGIPFEAWGQLSETH